jgi:hypothetical protein
MLIPTSETARKLAIFATYLAAAALGTGSMAWATRLGTPVAAIPCGILAVVGVPFIVPALFRHHFTSLQKVEQNGFVLAAVLGYVGAVVLFTVAGRLLPG